jgi:hypothetical protein
LNFHNFVIVSDFDLPATGCLCLAIATRTGLSDGVLQWHAGPGKAGGYSDFEFNILIFIGFPGRKYFLTQKTRILEMRY